MSDERALISQVLSGDMDAFKLLIVKNERLVAHMIGRVVSNVEDREELCQDVFLKVHQRLAEFNFESRLSTWIATIAYRHAINHLRKKRIPLSNISEVDDFEEEFVANDDPSEELAEKDLEEKVLTYIEELPVHYRTILTLYHVDGMNYSEIGKITNMPQGTVKNYLFRARHLLKEKVIRHLGNEEVR